MTQSVACPHCGFANAANAAFCGRCGQTLGPASPVEQAYCPYCESPNPPGATFCGSCGRAPADQVTGTVGPVVADRLICPVCETTNAPDASFCGNCGHAFVATALPASPSRRLWLLLLLPALLLVCAATAGLLLTRADGMPAAVAGLFADSTVTPAPRRPTPAPEQTALPEAVDLSRIHISEPTRPY